jgi:hypothetical protein
MSQADIRKAEQRQEQRSNLYTPRGSATTFKEKGKDGYEVKSHSYPSDLMSPTDIYGGNYVIFYINVAVDSKLAKTAGEDKFVNELLPRDRGDLIAQNFSNKGLFASNAALSAGGALLGSALGIGGVSAGAATLATVGAGAVASYAASATRAQKRLKTAIALHMPNQLQIRYGMQWSEDDTAAIAMVGAAGDEIMNALKSKDGGKNLAEPAKAIITNLALSKGPFAAANSAATGLAANPKKEQIFKGVDFRTFQFEYQFFPRSPEEAQNVLNIIQEFKYHMHPEFKDSNNFVYIYPSEFDIFYYQGGKENLNIHRHTSCVLTEMSVNYTPNGAFTTFENGMPTQINVQLSFRELALLTKDKVKDGL